MTTRDITPEILTSDHLDRAEALLCVATQHGDGAFEARNLGDAEERRGAHSSAAASHRLAGRFREEQRAAMKRAEVLAAISSATSLQRIADACEREALRR